MTITFNAEELVGLYSGNKQDNFVVYQHFQRSSTHKFRKTSLAYEKHLLRMATFFIRWATTAVRTVVPYFISTMQGSRGEP